MLSNSAVDIDADDCGVDRGEKMEAAGLEALVDIDFVGNVGRMYAAIRACERK